MGGTQVITH